MLAISLVTLGDPGQLTGGYLYHRRMADAASAHGAHVEFVSFPPWAFPLPAVAAPGVLRRASAADVVLLDSIAAAFLGPWLTVARRHPPLVAIVHQPPGGIDHSPARAALQARLDTLAYRHAVRIVAASSALAAEYATLGFPPERITVVAPGRDVAAAPAGPAPDLRAGRRAALLCVGNWVARKGILPLLDAFARLPEAAATLHLAGRTDVEPDYGRRVHARLQQPGLRGRVVVHGPVARERVAELYAGADVFVLAATREPYGTVYGEAMGAGLPVVGWRSGNLPHLATHEREGLMATPGDVEALAGALLRLVEDEPFRRRLAAAARERAASFPTWAESAAALFTELRRAAGR